MRKLMLGAMVVGAVALTGSAEAATTEVVTEGDVTRQVEDTPPTDDWVLYTRAGTPASAAAFEADADAPAGTGSLRLTTNTGGEKVFLSSFAESGTALGDISSIGYATNRVEGNGQQVTGLNVVIDANGAEAGGFATLVYEPVYNTADGPVVNGTWQTWDAAGDARWWSTRPIGGGQCAGASASCFRTWEQILAANPDAVVGSVALNQGSGNPGLVVNVDALTVNDTVYDLELFHDGDSDGIPDTAPPTDKDECKKGGFASFNNPAFRNQGQCVSYVASGR